MIYYKLTQEIGGRFWSFNQYPSVDKGTHFENPYCKQYKIGEWTTPDKNMPPLFIFDDLSNLKNFLKRFDFIESKNIIFECEIGELITLTDSTIFDTKIPCGTLYTNKIKLIKQIES